MYISFPFYFINNNNNNIICIWCSKHIVNKDIFSFHSFLILKLYINSHYFYSYSLLFLFIYKMYL